VQSIFEAGWLDLISGYLIKSSLILALALVLLVLLRNRSAGLRHLVLSLFLIGLLFLPVFSSLTTGWETGLLPTWQAGITGPAEGVDWVNAQDVQPGFTWESLAVSGDIPDSQGMENTSRPFRSGPLSGMKPVLGLVALFAWFMGSAYFVFRLGLGLLGAARMTREGRGMEDSLWKRLLNRFLAAVSLRRKVHLLSHDRIRIPLTWGIFRPVVMMPTGSDSWSESQRSSALYHELAHVKRGDFLVMLLARLSRALYWFNPLSWLVFRMIRKEQEKACDELVLKAGIKPSTYAENLLFIRNSVPVHWTPPAAVLGALGRSQLNDRLVAILKQKLNFEEVKMKTKIMLGILVVLSVSFIGTARPVSSEAGPAEAVVTDITVVQPPGPFLAADHFPQDQEKKQQEKKEKKEQEQKVKEEKAETTLVWTAKKGDKGTIQIIIDEKGEKKTIELTAPYVLTIKETPENTIVLTSPHLELKKGKKNMIVDSEGNLSKPALRLIGGLCEYAGSLTAFGNTVSSAYLRLVPHQEAPTRICWSDLNRSAMIRVPLGRAKVHNLAKIVNPGEKADFEEQRSRQTVELRSPDGSAIVHLLLAGIVMAGEWGFQNDHSLELADRLYTEGNVFTDKKLLKKLPALPMSCVESSRLLMKQKDLYEREGVFPPSVVEYVSRLLRAENDENMNTELVDLSADERLTETRKIMHKNLHRH